MIKLNKTLRILLATALTAAHIPITAFANGNLFGSNADFENGESGWVLESGAQFSVTNADSHTGNFSLELASQDAGSALFAMKYPLPVLTAGKRYVFAFWYRMAVPISSTINANGYNSFYVYVRSNTMSYVEENGATLINDGQWHQYVQTFTAETGFEALTHLGIRDYNEIAGAVYYFDDFYLMSEEELHRGLRYEAYTDLVTGREINTIGMDGAHTLHGYHTSQDTSDDGRMLAVSLVADENREQGTAYFDDFDLSPQYKTAPNILENASFERGARKWKNEGGSRYEITSDEARTGGKSLRLTGTATASGSNFLYSNTALAVTPDTQYVFSFWYKVVWPNLVAVDTTKTAKVQLRANPGNTLLVDTQKGFGDIYGTSGGGLTIDGQWHKFTATFNSKPKNIDERTEFSQICVSDTNKQEGAIYYFDDFSLRPINPGELCVSGLEEGDASPLFIDQNAKGTLTIDDSEYKGGRHSLKFTSADIAEDKSFYLPYIPLKKNMDYHLSFWYKLNEAGVSVNLYDASTNWHGSGTAIVADALQATEGQWRKYSRSFNSGTSSVVNLRFRCSTSGKICYFDDFALSEALEAIVEIAPVNIINTESVSGSVHVVNNSGTTQAIDGIMALYDMQTQKLLACDRNTATVVNGGDADIPLELAVPLDGWVLKAFAWGGTSKMNPLVKAAQLDSASVRGVKNGGFEAGIAPWEAVGDFDKFSISLDQQNTGAAALKLKAGRKSGMLRQKLSVIPNTVYKLSFHAMADVPGMRLGLYGKNSMILDEIEAEDDSTWQKYELEFDSSDNDEVEIRVFNGLPAILGTSTPLTQRTDLVFYDSVEKKSYYIDRVDEGCVGTSGGNQHLYRNEDKRTYSADMVNYPYQTHFVSSGMVIAPYSATYDGSYIGGGVGGWTGSGPRLTRIETATGVVTDLHDPVFPTQPFNIFNHALINPVNPDILYYGHGGIDLAPNQYAPGDGPGDGKDIMWIYDHAAPEGQKEKLLYKQLTTNGAVDGSNAEWITHVVFAADGQGVYGVKMPTRNSVPPYGIIYAPLTGIPEGGDLTYINSDYSYLHVAASPDGRYLVADTDYSVDSDPNGNYKIILIDLETKRSMLLTQFRYDLEHSEIAHAHPTFSNDGSKVIFSIDRGGYIWTAYMDITDIGGIME